MMRGAQTHWLADGRLHLHHGPIDLVIGLSGPGAQDGFVRAKDRFASVLDELVAELPRLREPHGAPLQGAVARRMGVAIAPLAGDFITPMAAVAGAVADEVLGAILDATGIIKAHVNNGGDVAFHLGPGQRMTAAIACKGPARLVVDHHHPWRGVATSGWGGRSHSFGIADSVTVLAQTAAAADAAATMIANAVDLPGHPAITRRPACDLLPESDLGTRPVTTGVGPLSPAACRRALASGLVRADDFLRRGLIGAAYLTLQGETVQTGALPALQPENAHA